MFCSIYRRYRSYVKALPKQRASATDYACSPAHSLPIMRWNATD